MGQFIYLGFCTEIVVQKRNLKFDQANHIHQAIEDHFGKNLYICSEDQSNLVWTLDPKHLKDGADIADFMKVQYERTDTELSYYEDSLQMIRSYKSYSELEEAAINHMIPACGFMTDPFDGIRIKHDSVTLTTTYLYFYHEGKIIMECYRDFLKYLTLNMRLANSEFACSKLARFFIT